MENRPDVDVDVAEGRVDAGTVTERCVARLILVRHGQSEWNRAGRFTGWADPYLTATGEAEARSAGQALLREGICPEIVHTSLQTRAIRTDRPHAERT